jgi:hypothetical protein
MQYRSEEQQPLENFFRAKGIKTKNEMADDVRTLSLIRQGCTDTTYHSLEQYLLLLSKTRTSPLATMELPQTAEAPTRTTRALMKTFKLIPSQKSAKSLIQSTRAVAQRTMLRWETRTVMLPLRLQCLNAQRRSRRHRNEQPEHVQRLRSGEDPAAFPRSFRRFQRFLEIRLHVCAVLPLSADNA